MANTEQTNLSNEQNDYKAIPQKKLWVKPEIIIIAVDEINAKSQPQVHEATGVQSTKYFSNPHHSKWFTGTKNQAIS